NFKEKFMDMNLQNIHLKNQMKDKSKTNLVNMQKANMTTSREDYFGLTNNNNNIKTKTSANITKRIKKNKNQPKTQKKKKTKKKHVDYLKNELNKYKAGFDINKEKIKFHRTYKVNDNNNFVLISDQTNKNFMWVNLSSNENKEIIAIINKEKDISSFNNL